MIIRTIAARTIFDSRGNPTVEVDVRLRDGSTGRASVPSGASVGSKEAIELRDGGDAFGGLGVTKAIDRVHGAIAQSLIGKDAADQAGIDGLLQQLDGTENKSKLGANAILAVSLAVAKAEARHRAKPLHAYIQELSGVRPLLPIPLINIFNGGKHADSSTDIQEFMIVPHGFSTLRHALQAGSEIFHALGKLLKSSGFSVAVGDEGGYAAKLDGGAAAVLDIVCQAVEAAGYRLGEEVSLALDVAATEVYHDTSYNFDREGKHVTSTELAQWYASLLQRYPIISIEDPFAENDWEAWSAFTAANPSLQIVGDDLIVTNPSIIKQAVARHAANAALIKPNQIGTLTETMQAVQIAQQAGWRTVMSHRSGETEDVTISHLAVGLGTGQIKSGSMSRTERLAKYNELLRIEAASGLPFSQVLRRHM